MITLPELKVTVYSDYICPFCYVGDHRLQRLRDGYDLRINWRFLEIHPETSPAGEPVEDLDYPSETWQQMMESLQHIAREEDIPIQAPTFITNSQDALLLSEAAKQCGREVFYRLHEALFTSYFVDRKNIGDRSVLSEIARYCNITEDIIDMAWNDATLKQCLQDNFRLARQHDIQSVPSFIFGDEILTGVVGEGEMRRAAARCADG